MDSSLRNYTNVSSSLPPELKQQILALSIQIISQNMITNSSHIDGYQSIWQEYIDVILYCCLAPSIFILMLRNEQLKTNEFHVTLTIRPKIQIRYKFQYFRIYLEISQVLSKIEGSKLSVQVPHLSEFDRIDMHFFQIINEQIQSIELNILGDTTSFLESVIPLYKKVTLLMVDQYEFHNFFVKRDAFTNLKTINYLIGDLSKPIDYTKILDLLTSNVREVRATVSVFDLTEIDESLIQLVTKYSNSVTWIADFVEGDLTEAAFLFLSRFSKIRYFKIPYTRLNEHEMITFIDSSSSISKLPIKKLHNNLFYVSNLSLSSESIEVLQIDCEECLNYNLAHVNKLNGLSFTSRCHLTDLRTFESIPSSVTELCFNLPQNLSRVLMVPKYVQLFKCRANELIKFDFSQCTHLTHLDLFLTFDGPLADNNEIWSSIPKTVSILSLIRVNREYEYGSNLSNHSNYLTKNYDILSAQMLQGFPFGRYKLMVQPREQLSKVNSFTCLLNIGIPDHIHELIIEPNHLIKKALPDVHVAFITQESNCWTHMIRTGAVYKWISIVVPVRHKLNIQDRSPYPMLMVCDDDIIHDIDCSLKMTKSEFFKSKMAGENFRYYTRTGLKTMHDKSHSTCVPS